MRIAIDFQAVQASNKSRGIGRYARSLIQGLIRVAPQHRLLLMLNDSFDDVADVRASFGGLSDNISIHVWSGMGSSSSWVHSSSWQRRSTELVWEAFVESLRPDVILVASLFEGFNDAAVTTVSLSGRTVPTAAVLYDLIPLIRRSTYLIDDRLEAWYEGKVDHLRRADHLLCISDSVCQEAIEHLGFPADRTTNISAAVDVEFRPISVTADDQEAVSNRYGIKRSFIMYTGGIDPRKNIERLVRSFAQLPRDVRSRHQLAIVCAADESSVRELRLHIHDCGFGEDEVIITGYIPDRDLLVLYNLCVAFVFPSLHEGFGLPVLEAMSCGRAVVAANTTSLPEIVAYPDAMFDPENVDEMRDKILRVLTDDSFRVALEEHSVRQAATFDWDLTASRVVAALESIAVQEHRPAIDRSPSRRRRLAYFSPLQPLPSGISDYSAELLRELSVHYEITLIVNQVDISDAWARANGRTEDIAWFRDHSGEFERVLYNLGNSEFHAHMFDLLDKFPGVVILHDFFLSGIVAHMDVHLGFGAGLWARELYHSHGYLATLERFTAEDSADVVWKYPTNLRPIQKALGIIVHSEASRQLGNRWYGPDTAQAWTVIPLLRAPAGHPDRAAARRRLGIGQDDFLVCSFGMAGPTKFTTRLIDGCKRAGLFDDGAFRLVLVGENASGVYGEEVIAALADPGTLDRASITGRASHDVYRDFLAAADAAVQLRNVTRGESSAAVLDCMNFGIPTIVNACGALADLDDRAVFKLPEEFDDAELTSALIRVRTDQGLRFRMADVSSELVRTEHAPRKCAAEIFDSIEAYYLRPLNRLPALVSAIGALADPPTDQAVLIEASRAIADATVSLPTPRQLFLDISELVQRDAGSGIQRVTRNIVRELLLSPPDGYRVEPVYATSNSPYRYAREFTFAMLNSPPLGLADDPIEYRSGDVFLGVDFQPHLVPMHRDYFRRLRNAGVAVHFVVYDLLPITIPETFLPGAAETHTAWLETIAEADRAIAISNSVANDLQTWLDERPGVYSRPEVTWFHLGCDLDALTPTECAVANHAESNLDYTFLLVGTLEPRKQHAQVLDAFERLWATGSRIRLTIAGKPGWMVDNLVDRISGHPELDRRLSWIRNATDRELSQLYYESTCLIAASIGEGFGLPLIEAARHQLPILARDIPAFREVAGAHASYFVGLDARSLEDALVDWTAKLKSKAVPSSEAMPRITWAESAAQLISKIGVECVPPVVS